MAQKPSIPKGMRDFSPLEMSRRDFIFSTIKNVFQYYGYQPIETPAMENLTSLLGKYGDEGDRLLFKVLNSGDYLNKVDDEVIESRNQTELTRQICDKGLRYDLTVPFARYVVQHRNEINFPFKRYQVQPVWRADRPQRGRYREFYQCDVDVIGSDSLLNEVELIQIIDEVFRRLEIKALVKLNNRKILAGIAEVIGESENFSHITVAMDKLDKIGLEKVNEEMLARGIRQEAIEKLQPILTLEGRLNEVISKLKDILRESPTGLKGCEELMTVMNHLEELGIQTPVEMDLSLARGLDYYTGAIIEVKATDVALGSICGGGRYDDLTGVFGLEGVSGVGISFGADRIYDVLMELDGFPETVSASTTALFVNFGEKEAAYCLPVLDRIRKEGIKAELFPDPVKLKKQLSWANNRQIPFIVMVGSEEIKSKTFMLKDMKTGEQGQVSENELINKLK